MMKRKSEAVPPFAGFRGLLHAAPRLLEPVVVHLYADLRVVLPLRGHLRLLAVVHCRDQVTIPLTVAKNVHVRMMTCVKPKPTSFGAHIELGTI